MKAILLSIKPEWIVKILNGEKTIEIRKLFPKDYVGWVYLYCSKGKKPLFYYGYGDKTYSFHTKEKDANDIQYELNGKVVARFWCDKVEEIGYKPRELFSEDFYYLGDKAPVIDWRFVGIDPLCNNSGLTQDEIHSYFKGKNGFAIHISKLEIFDEPRELNEFGRPVTYYENISSRPDLYDLYVGREVALRIKKAPINYMWVVEGE